MEQDLTIKELAQKVKRSPETLRSLARKGELRGAYKIGGSWRFRIEALDELREVRRCQCGGGTS